MFLSIHIFVASWLHVCFTSPTQIGSVTLRPRQIGDAALLLCHLLLDLCPELLVLGLTTNHRRQYAVDGAIETLRVVKSFCRLCHQWWSISKNRKSGNKKIRLWKNVYDLLNFFGNRGWRFDMLFTVCIWESTESAPIRQLNGSPGESGSRIC